MDQVTQALLITLGVTATVGLVSFVAWTISAIADLRSSVLSLNSRKVAKEDVKWDRDELCNTRFVLSALLKYLNLRSDGPRSNVIEIVKIKPTTTTPTPKRR